MKKILSVIFLSAILIFAVGQKNFAHVYDNITFVNATGRTIYYVYFVPNHYTSWGSDRLSGVWNSGNTLTLDSSYWKYWALKIVFDNGDFVGWYGNNALDAEVVWKGTIVPNGNSYTILHN